MKSKLFSILFLIGVDKQALSQTRSVPNNIFYEHTQTCNGGGLWTHENDFIVELFEDSSVIITMYSSDGRDQYASVFKYSFFGTYNRFFDSIRIKYFKKELEVKIRKGKIWGVPSKVFYEDYELKIPADSMIFYPEDAFLYKNDILTHDDFDFKKISYSKYKSISDLFADWDKPTTRKKKYFTWIED